MGQIQVEKNVGGIEGLHIITPAVHGDNRGYFTETYNQRDMHEAGLDMVFVQDNESSSTKGVLRGLHFQKQFPQGKLVRVIKGAVYDVAVDLRADSKTYGKWYGVELTEDNHKQFYISEGFAHGFSLLVPVLVAVVVLVVTYGVEGIPAAGVFCEIHTQNIDHIAFADALMIDRTEAVSLVEAEEIDRPGIDVRQFEDEQGRCSGRYHVVP